MDLMVTFADSTYELNGIYRENGTLNGYPSYKHESKDYYIFADNGGHYVLNNNTDMPDPCYFYGPQGTPIGSYSLGIFGSGNPPTVTEYMDTAGTITGFTVSGTSSTINVDGTYTLTDLDSGYSADSRVFSNGTYYIARFADVGGWYFATTYNNNFDVTQYCKAYDANNIPANDQAAAAATAEPSDVAYWWDLELFTSKTYSVTPIYGEDGDDSGGDGSGGETGEILGYNVAGAGLSAVNGYYGYVDEYNSKPYYTLTASGTTYYLYYYGGQTGWAINSSLSIGGPPLFYQGSDEETPDAGTWKAMASTPPTSITPVYDTTGGGDTGGDTPDTVPDAAPAVGDKGIMIGDIFIPNCPNPADSHLSKVSATGKNIAIGWFGYDFQTRIEIASANVEYQAEKDGWLSVAADSAADTEIDIQIYAVSGQDYSDTGRRMPLPANRTLRMLTFIPRTRYFKIVTDAAVDAVFYPCKGEV